MKLTRLSGLLAVALAASSTIAIAAGSWSTLPGVGQSSSCASTVTGTGSLGGITGQGQGSTGSVCGQTIPAGPPAITGNETIPADTNLTGGAPPQSVTITTGMLGAIGQGGLRNLLIGGDFFTNPWQRGTTPISATTATTATMTADRFFAYSSANTMTIAKKTSGADISATNNILASMQVNRPSGTDVTPICVGQVLPATETQNLLGRNAVLSFYGLNGAAMSAANGAITATIAYATAADSATPGTNTDAFAKSTITGYTAVTALSPNTTGTVASAVATIPLSTTWTRYAVYGAIPTTATTVGIKLCYTPVGTGVATDFFDIARVQLEATNQTSPGSFANRPPALEKSLAQAYSAVITEGAASISVSPSGQGASTTTCVLSIPFPVEMREAPTFAAGGTALSTSTWTVTHVVTNTALATPYLAATTGGHTTRLANMTATVSSGLTAGQTCTLTGAAGGSLLVFSAEP